MSPSLHPVPTQANRGFRTNVAPTPGCRTVLPAVVGALLLSLAEPLLAADPSLNQWAQWRGPLATGVAPQANPPTRWSETENVRWKTKIPGRGTSTPIIWENQVFVQTAIPNETPAAPATPPAEKKAEVTPTPSVVFAQVQPAPPAGGGEGRPLGGPGGGPRGPGGRRGGGGPGREEAPTIPHRFVLLALDRSSGAITWQKVVREEVPHEGHHRDHNFASHTPITDGKHVYGWFGSRGLHCYDMKGNLQWQKDLGRFRSKNGFGEGNSPALFGNTLVVNWDHEGEDFIVALDAKTGRELWKQNRDEDTTWTSPLILQHNGKAQVIVSATRRIRSYDLESGKQLWECGGMTANVIPTPVSDFGMVYAISGFRGASLLAIKLGETGDLTDSAAIAWRHAKATPYVPSPLLLGERLYFLSGNNAVLSAFNAKSGTQLIDSARLEGPSGVYASPIGASGRVYLPGRNGTSIVLKDSDQLEVLATNKLDDQFDASPAAAGRELFLRGHQFLYCLAEK